MKMFVTKLCYVLLTIFHFTQCERHNCYIQGEPIHMARGQKFIEYLCNAGYEVCCADRCCNPKPKPFYLWEIILTALLIFVFVLICLCGCYYCKKNFDIRTIGDVRNVETVPVDVQQSSIEHEFIPSAPVASNIAPPPAYDIAILCPRVHPQDKVPSYEEVSTKRF